MAKLINNLLYIFVTFIVFGFFFFMWSFMWAIVGLSNWIRI